MISASVSDFQSDASIWAKPEIAVVGVRNSCETIRMKRLRASNSSRSRCLVRSRCLAQFRLQLRSLSVSTVGGADHVLSDGEKILGAVAEGYWEDVGTLESYVRAHKDILDGRVEVNMS